MTSRAVAWLRLCRAPNTLTAAADVFAGAALSAASFDDPALYVVAAGSMLLYAGGVALNDVEDVEKDRTAHPERPLPLGLVSVAAASRGAKLLLLAGAASALAGRGPNLAITLFTIAAIVGYDKLRGDDERRFGPLLMGLARGGNLLRGACLVGLPSAFAWNAAAIHVALVGLVAYWSLREDDPRTANDDGAGPRALALPLYVAPFVVVVASTLRGFGDAAAAAAAFVGASLLAFRTTASAATFVPRAVFGLTLLDALHVLSTGRVEAAIAVALFFPAASAARRALSQRSS